MSSTQLSLTIRTNFLRRGFDSKEDAKRFIAHLDEFRVLVKERYSDYEIVDDFDDFSDEAK